LSSHCHFKATNQTLQPWLRKDSKAYEKQGLKVTPLFPKHQSKKFRLKHLKIHEKKDKQTERDGYITGFLSLPSKHKNSLALSLSLRSFKAFNFGPFAIYNVLLLFITLCNAAGLCQCPNLSASPQTQHVPLVCEAHEA